MPLLESGPSAAEQMLHIQKNHAAALGVEQLHCRLLLLLAPELLL
jgi:hypothetical protein